MSSPKPQESTLNLLLSVARNFMQPIVSGVPKDSYAEPSRESLSREVTKIPVITPGEYLSTYRASVHSLNNCFDSKGIPIGREALKNIVDAISSAGATSDPFEQHVRLTAFEPRIAMGFAKDKGSEGKAGLIAHSGSFFMNSLALALAPDTIDVTGMQAAALSSRNTVPASTFSSKMS